MKLDIEDLDRFFDEHFTRTAFRLETLDRYTVDAERENIARYFAGEPERIRTPWLDQLAADEAAGKRWYGVHIVTSPLSDYLRYEFEWGYACSAKQGQEHFILDTAEVDRPDGLVDEDFWLLDDGHVLKMHYDDEGIFVGAEPAPESDLDHYQRQRDLALERAVPFVEYWAAHPEFWRENWLVSFSETH
ncbi:MAG: DUF6879 family protein [Micromonosporaceae bacterium]